MATTVHNSFPKRTSRRAPIGAQPTVNPCRRPRKPTDPDYTLFCEEPDIRATGSGIQVTGKGSKHLNVAAFGTNQRTTGSAANAVAKTMLMALRSASWLRAPPAWPEVQGCASLRAGRLERPHLPLCSRRPVPAAGMEWLSQAVGPLVRVSSGSELGR
jgi:hypothetical protein